MVIRELTCISCPLGCTLNAEYDIKGISVQNGPIAVSGYGCKRGIEYAENEIRSPKRMVTTTLKVNGGGTLAVKTNAPVPKGEIFAVLKKLTGVETAPPVAIGQTVVREVSAGVDMVATQQLLEYSS